LPQFLVCLAGLPVGWGQCLLLVSCSLASSAMMEGRLFLLFLFFAVLGFELRAYTSRATPPRALLCHRFFSR
jgi:hypothetical protein